MVTGHDIYIGHVFKFDVYIATETNLLGTNKPYQF